MLMLYLQDLGRLLGALLRAAVLAALLLAPYAVEALYDYWFILGGER